jgi:membrane-associated progesterone receptor component
VIRICAEFDVIFVPPSTALLLYILYNVRSILLPPLPSSSAPVANEFKQKYSWLPKSHPPTVLFTVYSPKTLSPFSGVDGGRILLAIDGRVFDVTAGRNFYGPGTSMYTLKRGFELNMIIDGMYGNFAGRDASRGMAKQSFDEGMLPPTEPGPHAHLVSYHELTYFSRRNVD